MNYDTIIIHGFYMMHLLYTWSKWAMGVAPCSFCYLVGFIFITIYVDKLLLAARNHLQAHLQRDDSWSRIMLIFFILCIASVMGVPMCYLSEPNGGLQCHAKVVKGQQTLIIWQYLLCNFWQSHSPCHHLISSVLIYSRLQYMILCLCMKISHTLELCGNWIYCKLIGQMEIYYYSRFF